MHYSLLGSVTWNYEEVMTGLFVSLGGTWLEADVNREWTDTLLVEQSCTGTCFQHLLRNKLPSHSAVLRLNSFNSGRAEINEISHLGESAWVRKLQEDWVKREGDGHMRKKSVEENLWPWSRGTLSNVLQWRERSTSGITANLSALLLSIGHVEHAP